MPSFLLFRPSFWVIAMWLFVFCNYVDFGSSFGKVDRTILLRDFYNKTKSTTQNINDDDSMLSRSHSWASNTGLLVLMLISGFVSSCVSVQVSSYLDECKQRYAEEALPVPVGSSTESQES